jgi:diguanylate cyclase (GGDEF)-like protein
VAGCAIRLGGDEFAVLLPGTGLAATEALAEVITDAIGEPILRAAGPVEVGASVGAAAGLPGDADRLLRDADSAMYRQKADRKAHAGAR